MDINDLKITGELSDITVRASFHDVNTDVLLSRQDVPLHSTVLASRSKWFRKRIFRKAQGVTASMKMSVEAFVHSITGGFLEKSAALIEVHLPISSQQAFSAMLHWMYNAEVDINERTYNGLLDVAHKFEVEELLEDVIDFIIPRLNKDNCVEAWLNAVELQHERYERVTLDMLARSFAHVHLDPCLGDAVPGKIQDLLKHPALNVASEQQVFDFVRNYMQNIRGRHAYRMTMEESRFLWGCVRMHYLPRKELADLVEMADVARAAAGDLPPQDMISRALIVRMRLEDNHPLMALREVAPRHTYRSAPIPKSRWPPKDASPTPWHMDGLKMGWWHPGHRQFKEEIYASRQSLACPCCKEVVIRLPRNPPKILEPAVRRPVVPEEPLVATCCGCLMRPRPQPSRSQVYRDKPLESVSAQTTSGAGRPQGTSDGRGGMGGPRGDGQGHGVAGGGWRAAGGRGEVGGGAGRDRSSGAWRSGDWKSGAGGQGNGRSGPGAWKR